MSNLTSTHGGNITLILNPELCTLKTCDLSLAQLQYLPSVWGNAIFVGIFGLFLPAQLFLGIKYKTWGFMAGLLLGIALEVAGYVSRILLHFSIFNKNDFILYLIFLTIAPAFISAGIYICLSRIVMLYSPKLSRFRPRTYTIAFCSSDCISLVLQAVGGAIASTANTQDDLNTGTDIMVAGLIFQVVSLGAFVIICIDFAWRLRKSPDLWNTKNSPVYESWQFKCFLFSLGTATIAIIVRSIFRAIELSDGFSGPLANNEVLYMILEPPMISLSVFALTLSHPGVCFKGKWSSSKSEYKDGREILYSKDGNDDATDIFELSERGRNVGPVDDQL